MSKRVWNSLLNSYKASRHLDRSIFFPEQPYFVKCKTTFRGIRTEKENFAWSERNLKISTSNKCSKWKNKQTNSVKVLCIETTRFTVHSVFFIKHL